MKKRILFFACALLLAVVARAQWNGYEVKTIGTTPATTLNSGYYVLFQNGHKGFAFLSQSMLNLWGNNYNLAKNRINGNTPGISAFADLNQNIATGPAPNDRRWYVFKITNNGNGTCTIQCADGTYIPAFGNRVKLVSSTTPGVFTFHNHGNYFSFVNNGQGLNGDNYQAGYDNVSTLASWDYTTPAANGNAAWTLYPVEMERFSPTKRYKLKHVNSGRYLVLHDSYNETNAVDATTLENSGTSFQITQSGNGYIFKKFGTNLTLGVSTGRWSGWNTTNNVATEWNIVDINDGTGQIYITSPKGYLGPNANVTASGAYVYTNHPQRYDVKWQIEVSNDEVDVTYIYKCGNEEWYRETKTVAPGPYPELIMPPTGVKYANVPVGKVRQNETVVINCDLTAAYPLVYSQSLDEAQWVYFSNFDNLAMYFLKYNASTPNRINIDQTVPSTNAAFKWAFVGNPLIGFKIYNQAAGSGMILTSKSPRNDGNNGGNTNIHFEEETDDLEANGFNTHWNIEPGALGFYLMRKGEDMRANKRGNVFAFWNTGADGGSRMFTVPIETMSPVTSLLTANGVAVKGSKKYNIVNRFTGNAIGTDNSNNNLTVMAPGISTTQGWTLTASGDGFKVKNGSNKYLSGGPISLNGITSAVASDTEKTMYLFAGEKVNGVQYYYINDAASVTENSVNLRHFIGDDGSGVRTRGTRVGARAQWYLQEAVATQTTPPAPTVNYVGSISSGSYYRLVSNTAQSMTMTDAGGGVVTAPTDRDNYGQIWQLTSSSGGYTFKNLLTGKYIQGAPGVSAQWKTGNSGARFYTGSGNSGGRTVFYFTTSRTGWYGSSPNPDTYDALHSAPHQSNTVVGWVGSSDASKWLLEKVEASSLDMAAVQSLQQALNSDYTNQLANFFTDYACTQLKSNYASMSDAQLRNAMSALPAPLVEEAVRVKNNKWNDNPTWSAYEKDFRIHNYEVYSDPGVWQNKLGFGAFSRITQPTGIKMKSGDLVYLLVNDNVTDGDGHLYAEQVADVGLNGTQVTLKRGYNTIVSSIDCELFITYNCTNTNKPLSNYPDIKIHIVGGTCNGAFDMSRGHNNNDWHWLTNNMFKDKYLHLRSKYHVMNCYLDRVKNTVNMPGSLKIWDFVFETEEKLMTTQFNNGYYRPIMLVYDASGNNPNWSSGRVSMPGLYHNGAMNYGGLLYSGEHGGQQWVIEHEEGHGHQGPINLSGTTEVSNNGLAQIVNHIWGVRTSRGQAQNMSFDFFNNGIAWIDYPRSLMNNEVTNPSWLPNCTWIANKLWYQLWLYFHMKGDDGFFARWVEKMQSMNGGIKKTDNGNIAHQNASRQISELQGSNSTAGSWTSEYMRMALAACEASQTDLYEFFKMWGFFRYADEVKTAVAEDNRGNGVFRIGDYGTYYMRVPIRGNQADEEALRWAKNKMQSYSKKAPGALFINDTGELTQIDATAECLKFDPSLANTFRQYADGGAGANAGGLGTYTHFGKNEADNLGFSRSGTTITISGTGAVGFKIYDNSGELIYVSNRTSFTVSQAIANGIANGTYSLVASLGDDTDLLLSGPGTMYTGGAHAKSFDEATGVETINNSQLTINNDGWYTINGVKLNGKPTEKGIYIFNGKKVVVK